MAEFQVDVIFKSIKELQNEKLQNEKILAEAIAKRKEIECKLEAVMVRYAVVFEKHANVSEAVRVAEQKVLHAQSCVMKYEKLNQDKRNRVSELGKEIKREEEKRVAQLAEFEQQMNELMDKFRTAQQYYTDQSIQSHIISCEDQKKLRDQEVEMQERKVQELLSKIEHLKVTQEAFETEAIPEDTWQMVYDLFAEENSAAKKAYNISKELLLQKREEQKSLDMQLQQEMVPQPIEE